MWRTRFYATRYTRDIDRRVNVMTQSLQHYTTWSWEASSPLLPIIQQFLHQRYPFHRTLRLLEAIAIHTFHKSPHSHLMLLQEHTLPSSTLRPTISLKIFVTILKEAVWTWRCKEKNLNKMWTGHLARWEIEGHTSFFYENWWRSAHVVGWTLYKSITIWDFKEMGYEGI